MEVIVSFVQRSTFSIEDNNGESLDSSEWLYNNNNEHVDGHLSHISFGTSQQGTAIIYQRKNYRKPMMKGGDFSPNKAKTWPQLRATILFIKQ